MEERAVIFKAELHDIAAPVLDKNILRISGEFNYDGPLKTSGLPINVCNKCIPNVIIMLELALIKTSQIMVAENGGIT